MTTQVPAENASAFGQASCSSVGRMRPSTSAFRTGGAGGGNGRSSSSTGISATPISDIHFPAPDPEVMRSLARLEAIPPAPGAMGTCTITGSQPQLSDRPHEGRLAARGGPQAHGDMPAAAEGEALKQAFQHARTDRMVVADIGHQLPALLHDLERTAGPADLGGLVLRGEQRQQEIREFLCPAPLLLECMGDLVKILHTDQLAR